MKMKSKYIRYNAVTKVLLDTIKPGDRVIFGDSNLPYNVKGVSENFFVCTTKQFGNSYYCVCPKNPMIFAHNECYKPKCGFSVGDFIHSPDNCTFGYPFKCEENCLSRGYEFTDPEETAHYLSDLERGEITLKDENESIPHFEISQRHAVTDIVHLRNDYNENEVFGEPPGQALKDLMEVIGTTDRGIVNAIRNSAVIRWLLKFTQSGMRPEDIKEKTDAFAKAFLNAENSSGVAGTDVKAEAQQITPNDYVPNAAQSKASVERLYCFFNTSSKIVQSDFSENDWISYYESQVEPDLVQSATEHTRKLFNRRQRAFGNRLYLESSNLQYASMSTKLALQAMVDRGAMTPNVRLCQQTL